MPLDLRQIELPLTPFTLSVNATLRGRVTAIFGSSGAGKTTLLEIIAGLRRPARGSLHLDDKPLVDITRGIFITPNHRAIGYVPQEGALFPHLNVRQNLLYGTHAAAQGGQQKNQDNQALTYAHVTQVLEIAPLANRHVSTLSGGEKQRVALGRALLSRPHLLLLDEPLAGLDAPLKERLLPYLKKIRDEFHLPMIYVTHSADEVMALCDEVVVLEQGRITHHAPPGDLFVAKNSIRYELSH